MYFDSTELQRTLERYSHIYDMVSNGRKEDEKAGERAGKEKGEVNQVPPARAQCA